MRTVILVLLMAGVASASPTIDRFAFIGSPGYGADIRTVIGLSYGCTNDPAVWPDDIIWQVYDRTNGDTLLLEVTRHIDGVLDINKPVFVDLYRPSVGLIGSVQCADVTVHNWPDRPDEPSNAEFRLIFWLTHEQIGTDGHYWILASLYQDGQLVDSVWRTSMPAPGALSLVLFGVTCLKFRLRRIAA